MAQIKDLKRMCASYVDNDCDGCPLGYCTNYCTHFPCNMSDNADEIVDKWAEEHPIKTYMQDFFEKFPNALKEESSEPKTCVKNIYGIDIDCSKIDCVDCWNQEMKGE